MTIKFLKFHRTIPLVTRFSEHSEVSEQYRVIRTRVAFEVKAHQLRSLLVTSACTGEGKTTVAANLATVLADGGYKVLLVDADIRNGSLTRGLKINNNQGLSTLLGQTTQATITAHQLSSQGLYLLTSGPKSQNSSALFHPERVKQLVKQLKASYDLIIFDAPAISEMVDAQVLAKSLDGTILVVNEKIVSVKEIKQAKEIIEMVKGNLIGAISNFAYR